MNNSYSLLEQPTAATAPRKLNRKFLSLGAVAVLSTLGGVFYFSQQADQQQGVFPLTSQLLKAQVTVLEDALMHDEFLLFKIKYGKKYGNEEEEAMRLGVFTRNLEFIRGQNAMSKSYILGINAFADMTDEEFKAKVVGYDSNAQQKGNTEFLHGKIYGAQAGLGDDIEHEDSELIEVDQDELPDNVDWRAKGCVSPVRDQGMCESCWAFSAAGAVEGAFCAQNVLGGLDAARTISVQQIVDCATEAIGCSGGSSNIAYDHLKKESEVSNGELGVCYEDEYKYEANDSLGCRSKMCTKSMGKVTGYKTVPKSNEAALRAAVALRGPIAVVVRADEPSFRFFENGVFETACSNDFLNHAVLLTGYGVNEEGKAFWTIKNSWGANWGDKGYIHLGRGDSYGPKGQCGVQMGPNYPLVDKP